VKPVPFEWHRPDSLSAAASILAEVAPQDGRILAGGQSLLPAMALRIARPPHLVDINGLAELARLEAQDGTLRIGALVRHAAFHRAVEPGPLGRLMAVMVRHIAHWPIRTRGSFGGSLCHADPASEWPLLAAVAGAEMEALSVRGPRRIPVARFQAGPLSTTLAADELLVAVHVPLLPADTRFGFEEVARRAGDFAQAMALALLRLDAQGRIAEARIGLGGVEAVPRRLPGAEAEVTGRLPSAALFAAAGAAAAAECVPMEDASYRRALARAVVGRALAQATASAPQAVAA
jgi:carbon-monoxide dehydrogenase medium subunit